MSRPPTMHTQSPYENRPANNGLIDFNAPELHQALMMQAAPHMMMHPFQLQQQAITPNQILAQQACANGLVQVPNSLMQQANGLMPMQQVNPMMMQPTMLMTPNQLMAQGQYTMVAQPNVEAQVVPGPPEYVIHDGQKYFARKTEFTEEDVKRRAKDQTRSLVSQKSRSNTSSNKDTRSELVELNNRMQRCIGVY